MDLLGRSLYTVAGPRGFSFPSPTSLFFALPRAQQADTNSGIQLSFVLILHTLPISSPSLGHTTKAKGKGYSLELPQIPGCRRNIRTKKEALEAKREKQNNPRPPSYDPPPAPINPLWIALLISLAVLPLVVLPVLVSRVSVAPPPGELTMWICSSEAVFTALQSWLEPEILANNLTWTLKHTDSVEELLHAWRQRLVDLAIVEENLAADLYAAA